MIRWPGLASIRYVTSSRLWGERYLVSIRCRSEMLDADAWVKN